MPACELHLVYSATSFAAWAQANCASKTFEEDVKINPNSNGMGVSAKLLKFAGKAKVKTVTMRLGDVIISAIMLAPKC